ncbi:alpha/beta fold hydrolase [Robertkochia flava]|uniref:alpha/beta fold hydrolase n=1 Tax=Robertkochia flava TaxID=3447986 RepID=UPI001CCCBDFF|nr:alpha/beta fold hydrolase [Robertkochia marina]
MEEQLYSKILGKGTPLFILHGFLGMSDNWKTLGAQYADEGYEVHLIDQRNHGRSFHSERFDYTAMSEDLLQYANRHHIEQFLLLGHSMGGKSAMTFAVTHPEMVAGLLVADIAPKYYPPHHQQIINGLKAINLGAVHSRGDAEAMLAEHIKIRSIRQFLLKNLYRKNSDEFAFRFNLDVLAGRMEEIGAPLQAAGTYSGPTLFLRGAASDYIKDEDKAQIQNHFPHAGVKDISGAGHWLHAENPEEFLKKSLEFFNPLHT